MIVVEGKKIKVDDSGRFSLTDLWRISGAKKSNKPAYFLSKNGKAILDFLKADFGAFKPVSIKSGKYGGTYVCKELVYAYAMWLDPSFQVKVIRAFDSITKDNLNNEVSELTTIEIQDNNYKRRDSLLLSSITPMKKLDNLYLIEQSDSHVGALHGAALARRRGQRSIFKDVENEIINELQIGLDI